MSDPIPQPHGGALRPFRPGQSGNPAGRPPDSQRFLRVLRERHPNLDEELADAFVHVARDKEHKHWAAASKELLARLYGPAGEGEGISKDRVAEIARAFISSIQELAPEDLAERIVRSALDKIDGSRTVEAEVRPAPPDMDDQGG